MNSVTLLQSGVTIACYYATWNAWALGWSHFLPIFMTTVFSVCSLIYSEFFFMLLGLYFHAASYVLSIAQQYFAVMRHDPYCAVYQTYAYPSVEVFYSIALLTLVITYYFTNPEPAAIGVYGWLMAILVGFVPPFLLIFNQMNTWQEILSSALLAIVPTVVYVLLMRHAVQPVVGYILISPPACWFGYKSQFVVGDSIHLEAAARVRAWRARN